jgi:hypothetical protein
MDDGQAIPSEQLHLSWETRIRILANPQVWKPLLLVFGIPSVLLGILMAVIAKRPEFALIVPLVALVFFLGIFVLVAVVIDLFGGFKCYFFLTTLGVRSVSGRGARAASTATVIAGLLAGNPGAIGTGLLAESEQNVFIPWQDITRIKVKAGSRYVHIKREWGCKPIGLYCTAANVQQVMDILRHYAAGKLT